MAPPPSFQQVAPISAPPLSLPNTINRNTILRNWAPPTSTGTSGSSVSAARAVPPQWTAPSQQQRGVSNLPLPPSHLSSGSSSSTAGNHRTHGAYGNAAAAASLTATRGWRPGTTASQSLMFIVVIHPENFNPILGADASALSFFTTEFPRAPPDSNSMADFVARFRALGLAFDLPIIAKKEDLFAPFVERQLAQHMQARCLYLRPCEGMPDLQILPTDPLAEWQFLHAKSVGRNSFMGPKLHILGRPGTQVCTVGKMQRMAEKMPQLPPPQEKGLVVIIAPVRQTVVGLYTEPGQDRETLHACLAIRAWPPNQLKYPVQCLASCKRNGTDAAAENHAESYASTSSLGPAAQHDGYYRYFSAPPLPSAEHSPALPSPVVSPSSSPPAMNPLEGPSVHDGAVGGGFLAHSGFEYSDAATVNSFELRVEQHSASAAHHELELGGSASDANPEGSESSAHRRIEGAAVAAMNPGLEQIRERSVAPLAQDTTTPSLVATMEYTQSSVAALTAWRNRLNRLRPSVIHSMLISADTIQSGAAAIWSMAGALAAGSWSLPDMEGCRIYYFRAETVLQDEPRASVGDAAVGPGPLRGMFRHAMRTMVKNGRYWIKTSCDDFYTPLISGLHLSSEDLKYFNTCGVMVRLALLWSQDILPVSPLFLALVLDSWAEATNNLFVHSVAPGLASRLATWPPPRVPRASNPEELEYDVRPGQDPMNMVAEIVPNVQPSHVRHLPLDQVENVTDQLTAGLLFHSYNHNSNNHEEIIQAFHSGLDCLVKEAPPVRLVQTFGTASIAKILTGLSASRQVHSPTPLIPLLQPKLLTGEGAGPLDPDLDYEVLMKRWMASFTRYLYGRGHPQHDALSITAEDDPRADVLDEGFRATLFLTAVTESPYIPEDSDDNSIELNFRTRFTGPDSNIGAAAAAGIWAHTCSRTLDILLDAQVANLLPAELPLDPSITTDFDVYIHAALLRTEEYNTQ
ncbi:hypothetical protein K466DRAFT_606228 [Polyporus arcularius HHB13444]|uniref:Uncharacterized protein n=1 Tax=Polyporus arcularius HHB13444 TaxID=1314778 RepID=A0A5C3NP73_9APHY|nr:hypothetical protein K466DRAFT_606228 [Polyporus arcularius HHB13444]